MNSDSLALACYKQIAVLHPDHPVYVVQHETSGKLYVKKVLSQYNKSVFQQLMANPVMGTPCIREVVEMDGLLYVIEDYIPGDTLQDRLDENGSFSESDTMDIVLQLCHIVNRLHQLDPPIIHRDIKPSNIILTHEGNVKLLDMNAARVYTDEKRKDTYLLGTAGYAAPEQYGFAESSFQTDIFSIGVLMNVLLTGKLPTSELASGPLRPVIQRCTMMEPQKRYPSVQTLPVVRLSLRPLRSAEAACRSGIHIPLDTGTWDDGRGCHRSGNLSLLSCWGNADAYHDGAVFRQLPRDSGTSPAYTQSEYNHTFYRDCDWKCNLFCCVHCAVGVDFAADWVISQSLLAKS